MKEIINANPFCQKRNTNASFNLMLLHHVTYFALFFQVVILRNLKPQLNDLLKDAD